MSSETAQKRLRSSAGAWQSSAGSQKQDRRSERSRACDSQNSRLPPPRVPTYSDDSARLRLSPGLGDGRDSGVRRHGPAQPGLSERSCLARTGEVAAPSRVEQSVNVGDVWSPLVHTGSGPSFAEPRRTDGRVSATALAGIIGAGERPMDLAAAPDGRPAGPAPGRQPDRSCSWRVEDARIGSSQESARSRFVALGT